MQFPPPFELFADGIDATEQRMRVGAHLFFGEAEHLREVAEDGTGIVHHESEVGTDLYGQVIEPFTGTFLHPADFLLGFRFWRLPLEHQF